MTSEPQPQSRWDLSGSIGARAQRAIELECTARKAGNVSPVAAFHDLTHEHFLRAAQAIGCRMQQVVDQSVGVIVLESVRAMMDAVATNTSLGTILLFGPLAASMYGLGQDGVAQAARLEVQEVDGEVGVAPDGLRRSANRLDGLRRVESEVREEFLCALKMALHVQLARLTVPDSLDVYSAIRFAKPGGLGDAAEMDVRDAAPPILIEAMQFASAWDDVALQYVTNFELVFELGRRLIQLRQAGMEWSDAIRRVQIEFLADRVDSLIARKQGADFATEVQTRAQEVLASGEYAGPAYESAWKAFDLFLRDGQHRGNPGTSADLIAAALFVVAE